jgi:hypothetical protein
MSSSHKTRDHILQHTKEHTKLPLYIIKIRCINFLKGLATLPIQYVFLFAWWCQMLGLQTSLTEAIKENEQIQKALSEKDLDIEQRDHIISEQRKDLEASYELNEFLKRNQQQQQDEHTVKLKSTLDERHTHANKVFKTKSPDIMHQEVLLYTQTIHRFIKIVVLPFKLQIMLNEM